jgi:hypothetical protein
MEIDSESSLVFLNGLVIRVEKTLATKFYRKQACPLNAGRGSRHSGLTSASVGVLPCSSRTVLDSRRNARRNFCISGLAGVSGVEVGWPAKRLPQLANLIES